MTDNDALVHVSPRTVKVINPTALRTAKILWSFGCSECKRVNPYYELLSLVINLGMSGAFTF